MNQNTEQTEQVETEPRGAGSAVDAVVMWHGADGMDAPIRVECPNGLYPHKDANGVSIYGNTHFRTEDEAWENITQNALGGVLLAGRYVEQCKRRLQEANAEAGNAAELLARINRNKITRRVNAT